MKLSQRVHKGPMNFQEIYRKDKALTEVQIKEKFKRRIGIKSKKEFLFLWKVGIKEREL